MDSLSTIENHALLSSPFEQADKNACFLPSSDLSFEVSDLCLDNFQYPSQAFSGSKRLRYDQSYEESFGEWVSNF